MTLARIGSRYSAQSLGFKGFAHTLLLSPSSLYLPCILMLLARLCGSGNGLDIQTRRSHVQRNPHHSDHDQFATDWNTHWLYCSCPPPGHEGADPLRSNRAGSECVPNDDMHLFGGDQLVLETPAAGNCPSIVLCRCRHALRCCICLLAGDAR